MGNLLVKLAPDCYVEWSSIVDAPISSTMTLDQLWDYIREEYGRDGAERLPARLARCDVNGTSSNDGTTLETLEAYNRAGPGETTLSIAEIIQQYAPRDVVDRDGKKIGETYDCGEPGCCRGDDADPSQPESDE